MQLSLFNIADNGDFGNDEPLPLLVAREWAFDLQSHVVEGRRFYAVQDWMRGLTGEADTRSDLEKFKRNYPEFQTSLSKRHLKLKYKASDGKTYQRDFTTDEGLYFIAQYLRVTKQRAALDAIRTFLAKAGVFADAARLDPHGVANQLKAAARAKGIEERNAMTAAARDTHETHTPRYGALTDAEYQIILGDAKRRICEKYGFTPQQAANFRDQLGRIALMALGLAEAAMAEMMRQRGEALTHEEQMAIVMDCAETVAPTYLGLVGKTGVDRVRNQPVLKP
jgi:hypothetical protein